MVNESSRRADEDEIDLFELVATLWGGRWLIVLVTALFAAVAVAYALLATEWWRSEVVMVQVDTKSRADALGQLGGLASMVGINIGAAGGASQTPVAVLKSKDFIREFIEDKKLVPVLFADKWDASAGRWKEADPDGQPDIRDAVKRFDEDIRTVTENKNDGLLTLSVEWIDPVVSAEWANELVERVNGRLRNQALEESERNISYLQAEMARTTIVALQESLGRVLEAEMQKLLLAKGNDEFAFKVIDRAVAPKVRASPRRSLIVLLSVFIGALVSAIAVLVRARIASREHSS